MREEDAARARGWRTGGTAEPAIRREAANHGVQPKPRRGPVLARSAGHTPRMLPAGTAVADVTTVPDVHGWAATTEYASSIHLLHNFSAVLSPTDFRVEAQRKGAGIVTACAKPKCIPLEHHRRRAKQARGQLAGPAPPRSARGAAAVAVWHSPPRRRYLSLCVPGWLCPPPSAWSLPSSPAPAAHCDFFCASALHRRHLHAGLAAPSVAATPSPPPPRLSLLWNRPCRPPPPPPPSTPSSS